MNAVEKFRHGVATSMEPNDRLSRDCCIFSNDIAETSLNLASYQLAITFLTKKLAFLSSQAYVPGIM